MQSIVASIKANDVVSPLRLLLNERAKQRDCGRSRFHSIYRDILFLSFVALGRDCIDHGLYSTLVFQTFRIQGFAKIPHLTTGSIARSATSWYLNYSEANFEVFRPAGATRCSDGGEIWQGGGDLRSPPLCQISPPSVQR